MPKRSFTHEDIVRMLRERRGDRSIAALAADFGVTKQYMGKMLKGLEIPGPSILAPLGLKAEKLTVYREVA
jgi:hypothetical protein